MSSTAVVATEKPLSSWGDTRVRPRMMPRICVVPIFLVMDHTMPTGSMWNTASPMSHRKLYMPAQNWDTSARLWVPPPRKLISPMMLRKPRIRPPQMRAGMMGAKISPRVPMIRWSRDWFVWAAAFTASLLTPSMPAQAVNSL